MAGEAVRRQPLAHGVGVEEGAVDAFGRRGEDAVEADGSGLGRHGQILLGRSLPRTTATFKIGSRLAGISSVVPTKLIDVFLRDEYLRSYSVVLGFVNAPIFEQDYVDRARIQMQADGWSADEVQQARFVVRDEER